MPAWASSSLTSSGRSARLSRMLLTRAASCAVVSTKMGGTPDCRSSRVGSECTLDDVLDDGGLGRAVDVVKDSLDGVGEEVIDDVGILIGTVDAVEGDSSVI